jgi:hypothetical protein
VLHREPLSDDHKAMIESLTKAAQDEEQPVNLIVQAVDLSKEKPEWPQELYKHLSSPALPCAVLLQADLAAMYMRPDQGPPGGVIVWSGPLEKNLGQRLFDSPARREVARRLLKGESAVWVVLESGDKAKDGEAAETISKSLAELQETLKLPEDPTADNTDKEQAAPDDGTNIDVSEGVPLKVAFSVLRLSRTDPAEEVFVKMLLATQSEPRAAQSEPEATKADAKEEKKEGEQKQEDQKGETDKKGGTQTKPSDTKDEQKEPQAKQPEEIEPVLFVIFGRGRVLGSLTGKEIEADSIAGGCQFLTGDCSCVIKDNRPGTDLLMAVNWDAMLAGESLVDKALPPLTGVLPSGPSVAATEKAPSTAEKAAENETATAAEKSAAVATPATAEPPTVAIAAPDETTPSANDQVMRNLAIVLAIVLGAVVVGTVVLMRRGGEN